ncbi:phage holin family protein [Parasphingorhabdus sp.]|uniref:phage holin family protein n=1 Tax=Parasphingorhabdus sp. TaxID=2709688 RepID=UPI0032653C66
MKDSHTSPAEEISVPVEQDGGTDASSESVSENANRKSLSDQFSELVKDVRTLANVELEYYRTKLSVNMAATKTVLTLFALGSAFGLMTVIALVLGLIMIAAHYYGPIAATGLVTGGALLLTTILIAMAIKRARKLPLDEEEQ